MIARKKLDFPALWLSACKELDIDHTRSAWIYKISARKRRRWWELARRRDWERPILSKLIEDILDRDPMATIEIHRDQGDMELFVEVSCDTERTAREINAAPWFSVAGFWTGTHVKKRRAALRPKP